MNVHQFDGKLSHIFIPSPISYSEKIIQIKREIVPLINKNVSQKGLSLILSDLGQNTSHGINAVDILFELIKYKKYPCLPALLSEQLSDIYTLGSCNSGRVNRLFQILFSFIK